MYDLWRVAELEGGELGHGHPCLERGGDGVDRFVRTVRSHRLCMRSNKLKLKCGISFSMGRRWFLVGRNNE